MTSNNVGGRESGATGATLERPRLDQRQRTRLGLEAVADELRRELVALERASAMRGGVSGPQRHYWPLERGDVGDPLGHFYDRLREDPRFKAGFERIRTQVYERVQRAKLRVGLK